MPETPWRDADVTATCPACGAGLVPGHGRRYCTPACRQSAYRRRHAPPAAVPDLPPDRTRTTSSIYECPGCGERLAGHRRCPDCNLYARRLGTGGCCPNCGDPITITELLEAPTT